MLGDGTTLDKKLPVATLNMASGVSQISAALAYFYDGSASSWRSATCAVKTDGTVWCWGRCAERQCGYSATPTANVTSPVQVQVDDNRDGVPEGPLTGATSVTMGALVSCAIMSDTTAKCWGTNVGGIVGDGTTTNRFFAGPVVGIGGVGILSNIKGIALTGQYNNGTNASAIAILNDGNAVGWGANGRGQIGDNSVTSRPTPVGLVQP
jgi:alpha-tubulin suppressor-like RCC1 family protein